MKSRRGTWLVVFLVGAALAAALIALKYRQFAPPDGPATTAAR